MTSLLLVGAAVIACVICFLLVRSGLRANAPPSLEIAATDAPAPASRGTVAWESAPEKFAEVGGVTLSSSIIVTHYTPEKRATITEENRPYFERAYWRAMSEIVASPERVQALLSELFAADAAGKSWRDWAVVMQRHLPDGTWRWSAYDDYARPRDEESRLEDIEITRNDDSGFGDWLPAMKVVDLRTLYREHAQGGPKSPGTKKAQIIEAIIAFVPSACQATLLAQWRAQEMDELTKPWVPDYREMAELLCARIGRLVYSLLDRERLREAGWREWRFVTSKISDDEIPAACRRRDGKKFRCDDPLWDDVVPCAHPLCRCHIAAVIPLPKKRRA